MNFIDRVGITYGQLLVIENAGISNSGRSLWLCRCSCGNTKVVSGSNLGCGHAKSCGCLQKKVVTEVQTTHGYSKHNVIRSEYHSWRQMKQRCSNPKIRGFKMYGGSGIKVCDRWLESFENFIEDMGNKPSIKHSIDRYPNMNGNYEPGNCRWATDLEQVKNRRNTVWVDYKNETMTVADFKRKLGIKSQWVHTLLKRMSVNEVANYYKNKIK